MADVATYKGKPFADCSDEELFGIPDILERDIARTNRSLAREVSMALLFRDPAMAREAIKWNADEGEKNRSIVNQLVAEFERRLAEKGI